MIRVSTEGGLVIVDLSGRGRSFYLSCDSALRLALDLEEAADEAILLRRARSSGKVWLVHVESNRGKVGFQIQPPDLGPLGEMPLPPEAAKNLAALIRSQESMAECNLLLKVN